MVCVEHTRDIPGVGSGQSSYRNTEREIGKDVYDQFAQKLANIKEYAIKKNEKYYLDLPQIVIDDAIKTGVLKEHIFNNNVCTYCHNDIFYSYRYNHTDKRNYLIVMIKG